MKTTPFARRSFCAAMLLFNLGLASFAHAAEVPVVTMQELIAEPQQFEGQRVRVVGFLRLQFERNALYMARDDYNNSVVEHGLWLDLKNSQLRSSSKLNNGHVTVEGVFGPADKVHGDKWAGALKPVSSLRMWRKPRNR